MRVKWVFFSFLANNSGCVTFSLDHLHIFTANMPEFNCVISSSFSGVKKKRINNFLKNFSPPAKLEHHTCVQQN